MKAFSPQSKYIDINGLCLHYLDWKNKGRRILLLLHGFMSHAHSFDDFSQTFKDQYHIIALDQRGHGDSSWSDQGRYAVEDYFADLTLFIEALKLDDVILIGHSMGGRNALFYAGCNQSRIDRMIIIDARPAQSSQSSQAFQHLMAHLPLKAKSLDDVAVVISSLYPNISLRTCRHLATHGYHQAANGEFIPKYDTRMLSPLKDKGNDLEALWMFIKRITRPVLIVRGKQSPFLSPSDVQKMCEMMPASIGREIPDATHMPVWENPAAFNRVVSLFLNDR